MGAAYSFLPVLVVTALLAGTPFAAAPEVQQFTTHALSNTASNTPVGLSESNGFETEVAEERQASGLTTEASSVVKRLSSLIHPNSNVKIARNIPRKPASVWENFNTIYAEKTPPFKGIAQKSIALAEAENDLSTYEMTLGNAKKAVIAAEKTVRRDKNALAKLVKKKVKKNPPGKSVDVAYYENLAASDGSVEKLAADLVKSEATLATAMKDSADLKKKIADIETARLEFKSAVSDFFNNPAFKTWYKEAIDQKRGGATVEEVYNFLVQEFENPWLVAAMIDLMRRKWTPAGKIASQLEMGQFDVWTGKHSNLFVDTALPSGKEVVPPSVFSSVKLRLGNYLNREGAFMGP